MNAMNRKTELMTMEIVGTREELETLAHLINNELVWDDVEAEYGVTAGFLCELHTALTKDAE